MNKPVRTILLDEAMGEYQKLNEIDTIKGDQVEIICFILDIIDNDRYNKIFGYRKK